MILEYDILSPAFPLTLLVIDFSSFAIGFIFMIPLYRLPPTDMHPLVQTLGFYFCVGPHLC